MADTNGFLFFYDWAKPFSMLSGDEFKELLTAMMNYQRDGTEPPEFEGTAAIIAAFVFPQLKRRTVNSKLGSLGGKKRVENKRKASNASSDPSSDASSQSQAQDKDIDIDKDIDKDEVKVKDKDEVKNKDVPPKSPKGDVRELEAQKNNSALDETPFFSDQTFEQVPETAESEKADLEERFNTFWEEYPKKVAREPARKAYLRLKPDKELSDIMLRALKEQQQCSQWKDSQYIPNPATWINGRRWEDETPVPAEVKASSPSKDIDLYDFFEN